VPRLGAEAVDANLVIEGERTRPDERSKLSGGAAPRQIHLEEAILRVEKAEGARDIFSRCCVNGWNAERVAFDRNGCGETFDLLRAVDPREAGADAAACPERAGDSRDEDDHERDQQRFEQSAHRVRHVITIARGG